MDKKIIFQKCNFNNIFFLFYIVKNFVNLLIEYKLYPNEKDVTEPDKYFLAIQIINFLYINNLFDFLAIIPYFIRKKLIKGKEEENINLKAKDKDKEDDKKIYDSPLIYNDNQIISNKKRKKMILFFILIAILDFYKNSCLFYIV